MWEYFLNNLPLAIILIIAIIVCGADLIKAIGVWRDERKKKINSEVQKVQKENELCSTLGELKHSLDEVKQKIVDQDERFEKIESKLDDLTISDMHNIKSWLVDQYHKFYVDQGWIDAFNAETIDRRYEDYKKEGGNSYIDTLIERIHTLPMDPPVELKK